MANPNWVKGMPPPNPRGRPSVGITWANYNDIVLNLLEKYDHKELIQMGNQIAEGRKNLPVSSLQALVIVNIASALQKEGKERERLLDRLIGKALQRVEANVTAQVNHQHSVSLETLSDETLLQLRDVIARAKSECVTIDNEPKMISAPVVETEAEDRDESEDD